MTSVGEYVAGLNSFSWFKFETFLKNNILEKHCV